MIAFIDAHVWVQLSLLFVLNFALIVALAC